MVNTLPSFLEPCEPLPGQPSTTPCLHMNAKFPHKKMGASTHALWWPAATPTESETCILFLPGNPGLLDFYTPYLTAIYEKAQHNLCILAHSFIGHTPGIDESSKDVSKTCLTSQIEAVLEAVDTLKAHYRKLVIVAHSAGCWVTLQAMKSRENDVDSVFLLFPTIRHIVKTPNGEQKAWLFNRPLPLIISWLSILTRLFPMWLLRRIFPDWPDAQLMVLRMLLNSPDSAFTCLTMSKDEMETIQDLDIDLLKRNQHKIHMYFAETDHWVGDNKAAILREFEVEEGNLRVVHGPEGIPHSFCINHGEDLAEQSYQWLKDGELL